MHIKLTINKMKVFSAIGFAVAFTGAYFGVVDGDFFLFGLNTLVIGYWFAFLYMTNSKKQIAKNFDSPMVKYQEIVIKTLLSDMSKKEQFIVIKEAGEDLNKAIDLI